MRAPVQEPTRSLIGLSAQHKDDRRSVDATAASQDGNRKSSNERKAKSQEEECR
jgi:hypothetical protein